MRINGNLVLNDNASGEIRQVYIERLDNTAETTIAGTLNAAHVGRIIFNTTSGQYKYWDGTDFVSLAVGSDTGAVQTELDAVEAAVGLNTDGTLIAYSGTNYLNAASTIKAADVLLDTQIKTNADAIANLAAAQGKYYTDVVAHSVVGGLPDFSQTVLVDTLPLDVAYGTVSGVQLGDLIATNDGGSTWTIKLNAGESANVGAVLSFGVDLAVTSEWAGPVGFAETLYVNLGTTTTTAGEVVVGWKALASAAAVNLKASQAELDATQAGAGLNADGTLPAYSGTNYLDAAATIRAATVALDTQVKANTDGVTDLQTEVDAIETAAGLNADGTLAAYTGTNYLDAATSLKNADVLLDTAIATKEDALGYVPVNKAGDSLNGNLTFGGTSTVTNLTAPVNATDAVRKVDLDTALAGLDFQPDVDGLEAEFAAAAGRFVYDTGAGFTDPNVLTPAAGDIVVVDAAGAIQSIAYDVSAAGEGALTWNRTSNTFIKWDGTTWAEFGGLAGVTAGTGLSKSGNTISVLLGAGIADVPTGEVGIELKASAAGLELVDPSTGDPSSAADAVLAAKVAGPLELTVNGIDVAAAGITEVELAASVAGAGLTGGAGTALGVGAGTGITVTADAVAFDETYGDARYINTAGDTMTGTLVLAADGSAALDAVPKQQLDAAVATLDSTIADIDTDIAAIVTSLNKTYYVHPYTTTGATAAISVVHNLGVKYCNVTVVDDADEVFIPQSITFIDTNTLEVTLNTDISGNVVVMGHATLTLA